MDISKLPPELLQQIGEYLNCQDLSSLSRLSSKLHWCLFYPLFDRAIAKGSDLGQCGNKCLVSLFFHAVKHHSTNIAQYLSYSARRIDLNGYESFLEHVFTSQYTLDRYTISTVTSPKIAASGDAFSLASLRTSPSFILPCWQMRRKSLYTC
jgi:hypothetical protein